MLMRIAICDDNDSQAEQICSALKQVEEKLEAEFAIETYYDGTELLKRCQALEKNYYTFIFFDIVMKVQGGITAAAKLREMGWGEVKYIFVSSYDTYFRALYPLDTAGFIDKPFTQIEFEKVFLQAYRKLISESVGFFEYTKDRMQNHLQYKCIIYFEVSGHVVSIHYKDENKQVAQTYYYDKISNIWERIKERKEFIMPTKSFIVNLDYVQGVSRKALNLMSGQRIPISRQNLESTTKRCFSYYKGKSYEL